MATKDTQENAVLSANDIPELESLAPEPEITRGANPDRKVKIKLHMDKKKGKGIYVNVNDHRFFIPRGQTVEVPYYIAAVLANSVKQDEETAKMIEALGEKVNEF